MSESSIQILPENEAVDQIVETVQQAPPREAPFTLVLGSGFSFGLVPTVRELITETLPLWMRALKEGQTFEEQFDIPVEQRPKIAAAFWRGFLTSNSNRGLQLSLDSEGLPENFAAAYQAVFSPKFRGAIGRPLQARNFQRTLMRLDDPRLHAPIFSWLPCLLR
jgi:hypothetical protein